MNRPLIVLASASSARLKLLKASGVYPVVIASDVDEDAVLRERAGASAGDVGSTGGVDSSGARGAGNASSEVSGEGVGSGNTGSSGASAGTGEGVGARGAGESAGTGESAGAGSAGSAGSAGTGEGAGGELSTLEKVNVLALAKAGAVYKQVCNINNAGTSVSAGESAESVAGSRSASMGNTGASAGDATPAGGAAGAVYEQVCKELGERNLFIVGCDSLFDVDGKSIGKPYTKENAMRCLKKMSGKTGTLYTGHAVINCKTGERVSSVCASEITLDHLPDEFIDAYTDTSEPLESAGSFTLEGLGAAYISSINGSYTNILGLSIPTLRELLEHFNIQWTSLWHDSQTEIDKRNI